MRYLEAISYLNSNSMTKESSFIPAVANLAAKAGRAFRGGAQATGQGLWNIGFGGETTRRNLGRYIQKGGSGNLGNWSPFQGLKNLGKAKATYTKGPLQGMRKYDPATGLPEYEKGLQPLKFLKQEWEGNRPGRANFLASQMLRKGQNQGQFLRGLETAATRKKLMGSAPPKRLKDLEKIKGADDLSIREFITQNPKAAAKYYGLNLAQKGLLAGMPALEVYDAIKGENPETKGHDIGSALGEGLGFTAGMPLGFVGAPLLAMGMSNIGGRLGSLVDKTRDQVPTNGVPANPRVDKPTVMAGRAMESIANPNRARKEYLGYV